MIYYLIMPFLSLLLLIFQVNILDLVFFGKIGLEISLLIVIFAGFRLSMAKGGTLSFVLGFIFDCITGSITGFHTFFYIGSVSFSTPNFPPCLFGRDLFYNYICLLRIFVGGSFPEPHL